MKQESLVIADQNAAVNMCPGLVHTARHITEVYCILNKKDFKIFILVLFFYVSIIYNWGEVVTR
jgi:mannose/fructose/N-acetylgalactosamine-specific phosphotransferase system component IID